MNGLAPIVTPSVGKPSKLTLPQTPATIRASIMLGGLWPGPLSDEIRR